MEVLFDGRWGVVCRTTTTSSVTPSVSVDEAICGQLGHSREDTRIIRQVQMSSFGGGVCVSVVTPINRIDMISMYTWK